MLVSSPQTSLTRNIADVADLFAGTQTPGKLRYPSAVTHTPTPPHADLRKPRLVGCSLPRFDVSDHPCRYVSLLQTDPTWEVWLVWPGVLVSNRERVHKLKRVGSDSGWS
jgi:hypothetical protein